uniref:Late embryogenesis abundant protein LEA-2 subgroup domain-containing protein n=1 Tax=Davidia involucrata TaxID=16924 RepID=A0A5B7AW29_DAVIN
MATPAPPLPPPQAARRRHSKLVRCIAIVLLALIVLVGIAVLILWLAIKPKRFVYTIEDGSVHGFNLNNDDHFNATFDIVLRSYNPNGKVSIYYDKMEVTVSYEDEMMAFNTVDPFFQPHRNVTRLEVKLMAQDVSLIGFAAKNLRLEKSSGEVELDVRVKAKVRLKVGVWKSGHRTLKIFCSPVLVHFSSSKGFERTFCDVDL